MYSRGNRGFKSKSTFEKTESTLSCRHVVAYTSTRAYARTKAYTYNKREIINMLIYTHAYRYAASDVHRKYMRRKRHQYSHM